MSSPRSTAFSPPTSPTAPSEKFMSSRWSEASFDGRREAGKYSSLSHKTTNMSLKSTATATTTRTVKTSAASERLKRAPSSNSVRSNVPIFNIVTPSASGGNTYHTNLNEPDDNPADSGDAVLDNLETQTASDYALVRADKASRILGIQHRRSMEPIPASTRTSLVSTRSVRDLPSSAAAHVPTLPLTSLYVVSGLPKSPHTWTLSDPDSVLGLHHSEGAVNRWWRPEVLGSTVSPGAGGSLASPGGKKKKKGKSAGGTTGAGALSKQEVGKMLSKALKLSFSREVEVIASTLQPASTVHTFTFALPNSNSTLDLSAGGLLRSSVFSATTDPHASTSALSAFSPFGADADPFSNARPSSAYLGPPNVIPPPPPTSSTAAAADDSSSSTVTYHGVCLTVWSHADAERSAAIRRTLEAGSSGNSNRARKESVASLVTARLKSLRADASGETSLQARRRSKRAARSPWAGAQTDGETDVDGDLTEGDGGVSESDFEGASTINGHAGHGPGESTLFLPGDTVFWLPYALTLVSRHPIYDLMRDYLTLSWARFSKDVQSHTLQISKILSHPAPRPGDLVRLDASAKNDGSPDGSLEVIARFPGGLDFGRGLVDTNFTMWPLFKALNIDNILTICEIALAPTGRIVFYSRHPAMLGIAVMTIKYLVELRGWNGIALPTVHSRDAKIYVDDPGPWIIGLATEARYSVRPGPEVCVVDLDINYLSCASPPPGVVSAKQQRDRFRQRLMAAFEPNYFPDHGVPSEFKEAFPAGRFRPVCKIQAKRGAASTAVADMIKPPEWWHSTRIIQAFDSVLQEKMKKPSFLKRISTLGSVKRPPRLSAAELHIQMSIRKRATAFVDARDDLETKIGRLSRRLNFLLTESDLWRDKFVTFEQYAEKLSLEASDLRTKVNKEQKETKRLSTVLTTTNSEKSKLQSQLRETEVAHKEALSELQRMRNMMEKMEEERAAMVSEVEAQIEKALASMAAGMYEEDSGDDETSPSRPGSRVSNKSRSRSRAGKRGDPKSKHIRSFGTESTLAESSDVEDSIGKVEHKTGTLVEEDEEDEEEERPTSPTKKKRFSATDLPQDGMVAVDEGISERSDKIAQKMQAIQQKLETALSAEARPRKGRSRSRGRESGSDSSASTNSSFTPRPRRSSRGQNKAPMYAKRNRTRSGTTSSTQTGRSTPLNENQTKPAHAEESESNARLQTSAAKRDHRSPDRPRLQDIPDITTDGTRSASPSALTPSTPALTPGGLASTDDSDTDFQSAYSASPRTSSTDGENLTVPRKARSGDHPGRRGVRDSAATLTAQPSPTFTEDTIISPDRFHAD